MVFISKLLPVGVSGDVVFGTPNNTVIPLERNYVEREFILSNGDNLELVPTLETLNVVSRGVNAESGTAILPERGDTGNILAERYTTFTEILNFHHYLLI